MIKKNTKLPIIIISVLIVLFAGVGYSYYHPIFESNKFFEEAQQLENNKEYIDAYNTYQKVIEKDKNNFELAKQKIDELTERFEKNKIVAMGYEVCKERSYLESYHEMKDVQVGNGILTCRIDDAGCLISKEDRGDSMYNYTEKSSIDGYYATVYLATMIDGFLSGDINRINQDTSEALFKTEELRTSTDLLDDNLIKTYIKEYEETGNIQ